MKNLTQDQPTTSTLDDLLAQAQEGEVLIDPKVGKHDNAYITNVRLAGEGDKAHPVMTWGGLIDSGGNEFLQDDHLYLPKESHPVFVKQRFMSKLKTLGIVPQTYQNVLYFTLDQVPILVDKLQRLVGKSWPLTISQDNEGFMKITLRKPPKAPF